MHTQEFAFPAGDWQQMWCLFFRFLCQPLGGLVVVQHLCCWPVMEWGVTSLAHVKIHLSKHIFTQEVGEGTMSKGLFVFCGKNAAILSSFQELFELASGGHEDVPYHLAQCNLHSIRVLRSKFEDLRSHWWRAEISHQTGLKTSHPEGRWGLLSSLQNTFPFSGCTDKNQHVWHHFPEAARMALSPGNTIQQLHKPVQAVCHQCSQQQHFLSWG